MPQPSPDIDHDAPHSIGRLSSMLCGRRVCCHLSSCRMWFPIGSIKKSSRCRHQTRHDPSPTEEPIAMPVAAPMSPCSNGRTAAVRRAIELMRDNLCEQLSLTDLARMALFSPFHFHRLFREATGLTPARFLAALRMAEARRLLLHTDLTVAAVGSQVGYASAGTFTTQFTRLVGEPPARFRHLARQLAGQRWDGYAFAPAWPVPSGVGELAVTVTGDVPEGCLIAGLEPTQDDARVTWAVRSTGGTALLATAPGLYRLRVVVVESGVPLTDALIDDAPGSRLVADVPVRLGPGRHAPVVVALRAPWDLDPPVLAAAPLRRLVGLPKAASNSARRVS
ncbi:helix-turn-helix domain-containing protein [Micromonospora sp. NPDC003776]